MKYLNAKKDYVPSVVPNISEFDYPSFIVTYNFLNHRFPLKLWQQLQPKISADIPVINTIVNTLRATKHFFK